MQKFVRIQVLLLLCILIAYPQKKELLLKDVVQKATTDLAPQKLKQVQWMPNSDRFSYTEEVDTVEMLFIGNGKNGKIQPLLPLTELNDWLAEIGMLGIDTFPKITWRNSNSFWFWREDTLLTASLAEKQVAVHSHFQGKNANRDVAKNLIVAFTRENNLYILKNDSQEIAITEEKNSDIVSGQEVHRREFGISEGTFWSPQNHYLAFYRKDESLVTDYPYVDFTTRPAQTKPDEYPMAGQKNHIASIGVYNLKTGRTTWLETGEPKDQYLANPTWSPDEKFLYVTHINRNQNHLRMIKYSVESSEPVKTLFEEREDKYVDPQTGPYFLNRTPDRFVWLSRRDGWNHFYLYNSDGNLIKQVTKGEWEVVQFKGSDDSGNHLYFIANKAHPIARNLYRVKISNGAMERLTSGRGTHKVYLSESGDYCVDELSNLQTPATFTLYDSEGKKIRELKKSPNPLEDYITANVEIEPIYTDDGDSLFRRISYPPDFDDRKSYPLVLYVYGGPHSQKVRNTWLGGLGRWPIWLNYLSTKGYIVLTVDNRGTDYRGKRFEQQTFRRLGTVEVEDQVFAVKKMIEKPYVDSSRVGVVGWSYGGYMATSLMLRAPNLFKVGIAGAPVTDWCYYETIYTERYMDTPDANPDGYAESSTLNYVDQLKGKLLLIHGTSDNIVMWQHTILFLKAAIQAGVHPDYFVYPGHLHGIKRKERVHLFERMTGYIHENL